MYMFSGVYIKNLKSVFGGQHRKTVFGHNQKYKKKEIFCSITNLTENNLTENNLT